MNKKKIEESYTEQTEKIWGEEAQYKMNGYKNIFLNEIWKHKNILRHKTERDVHSECSSFSLDSISSMLHSYNVLRWNRIIFL